MGRFRKHWYEREEVKKINADWVKTNVKLTNREMEILEILRDRKLVRRDMLEIISPSYRNLGKNRTQILNKSIRKLFEKMCIDKIHEEKGFKEGNSPAIISLDKAGSIILGIPHRPRIKQIRKEINGNIYIERRLPINYRHINGVNKLEVETILLLSRIGGEIVKWEHETPINLFYGQEKILLIPDVSAKIKLNSEPTRHLKTLDVFIEYDTGSESIRYKEPPIIRDKIIKYKKYKLSNVWEDSHAYFPLILFVTEDQNRIKFFNKKCKENGIRGLGIYYKNYSKVLEKLINMI